jgi:hypothetical protein
MEEDIVVWFFVQKKKAFGDPQCSIISIFLPQNSRNTFLNFSFRKTSK